MTNEDIGYYIHNISTNWRKSVVAILDVADLVVDAENNLSPLDWYRMKNADDFSFGDSWISKMKTISRSKRFKSRKVRHSLPANYNLIYQYARLSDDEWESAKDNPEVISPDATLKMMMEWLIEYRHQKHTDVDTSTNVLRLNNGFFAGFTIPTSLNEEVESEIKNVLSDAQKKLKKLGVEVVYADSPTPQKDLKDKLRNDLAEKMSKDLNKKLANRGSLSFRDIERIESVLYQHKHHQESGKYPYSSDHRESIEHPKHERNVKKWPYNRVIEDLKMMKKRGDLPITSYTPIRLWKDMTEERCMKYVLEHSRTKNRESRYRYKSLLQDLSSTRGNGSRVGKKYLEMLVD